MGVLGGGAWGTALAFHCVRKGHNTMLWARETEVVEGINGSEHENTLFLKVRLAAWWCVGQHWDWDVQLNAQVRS